jgi:antibiotic biosynthesis monooxygenase (ABM) superfamily enzyme
MRDNMAFTSNEEPVVELITTISIEPKNQQHYIDNVQEILEKFADNQPGFISAKVYKSLDGTRIVYSIQWKSIDDGLAYIEHIKEILEIVTPEIKNADYHLYEAVKSYSSN